MTDDELQQLFALDGGAGPALAIDAVHADAIVEAALAGAGFGPGGGSGGASSGGAAASGASTLAKGKLALLGGAVVLVVIAAIAWRAARGQPQELAVEPDAPAIDAGTGTGSALAHAPAEPDAGSAKPAADHAIDDEPEDAIEDAIEIEPSAPDRDAPARPAKPARHHVETETAADLLGAANAKRAAKEWRASDELYARVVERAPNSLAAQTALVASASLHLEHLGDPKGAARRFSRALAFAPRGALAEDARWGLAEAARALHDTAAEKAALDDFLAHHATSPLAPRAKARRAELP
jgi:hypothetical protein